MNSELIAELIELRRRLHRHAEPSGAEEKTCEIIVEFVSRYTPDDIVTGLGGTGLAAVYNFKQPGPSLMFRAELDALPIRENNDFAYRSRSFHLSHKCGHDGHMAIVSGLAALLRANPAARGRVILLYQPAEETGQGAADVIASDGFSELAPDYVFALHNLPGIQTGTVLIKEGVFNFASTGMRIVLEGKTAHASQPENGISPAAAMCDIIQRLSAIPRQHTPTDPSALVTVVYARLGEKTFGTAPGFAEIMVTLRCRTDETLREIKQEAGRIITAATRPARLDAAVTWHDHFSACCNRADAVAKIVRAAKACGQQVTLLEHPFRWSEDFGRFTASYPGAIFALGAGKGALPLHSASYDFPDTLIPIGLSILWEIINQELNK